jgi:CheY-like chemotaxis protein
VIRLTSQSGLRGSLRDVAKVPLAEVGSGPQTNFPWQFVAQTGLVPVRNIQGVPTLFLKKRVLHRRTAMEDETRVLGKESMTVAKASIQETILLVEDDVSIRVPIAQYLRECGYKVIEAINANEAMTVLLDEKTIIDVVFSNVDMPSFTDAFGLSKWLREKRPGLEVILIGTVPRAVNAAKQLCDDGPLPKPPEPQALHDHISRLLAARKAKVRD